ncbi:hypothetical protein BDZ89DRAFT_1216991 [Hymenopellis radicata]|nr:hypothetical protein BDZ89DRAFT_1216991 [Hymenopellis radicata]
MAPSIPPQTAPTAELASSGLSPVVFWLVLIASSAYFYLIPCFWPGSIIKSTLQRCKEAQGRMAHISLGHSTLERQALWDKIRPESPDNFMGNINSLRARNSEAWNDGVFGFLGALWGLYKDARVLLELGRDGQN